MYRFALRPAWILSHLLVLLLVVVLAGLGFWQVQRHGERQARNSLVESRSELAPVPVETLLDDDPAAVRFRPVEVTGSFVPGRTILIDNRTLDGRPGAWLIDPVVLVSGDTIVVNRGFEPFVDGIDIEVPEVPSGQQTFVGLVEQGVGRTCARIDRNETDIVARFACVDLDEIAAALALPEVLPFEVRATVSIPASADSEFPSPVPPPELGNGPHLGYAVQWFIFTTIAIVGYPLVLRRVARHHAAPDAIDQELRDLLESDG